MAYHHSTLSAPAQFKRCHVCRLTLPVSRFSRLAAAKDGYQRRCKDCYRAYVEANRERVYAQRRAWDKTNEGKVKQRKKEVYLANRDAELEKRKENYQQNKGRYRAQGKQWREQNRESAIQYGRDYYRANRTRIRLQAKEYLDTHREALNAQKRLYYAINRAVLVEKTRQWALANPDKVKIARARSKSNRRAVERLAAGHFTSQQLLAKCDFWGWRCYLCGANLTIMTLTIDHRKPLSRDGSNWPANLAPCCLPCNLGKGAKTESEYSHYRAVKIVADNIF